MKGIIINQDADGFIGSCKPGFCTKEKLENYAKMFGGSQITDYFITLNNTNCTYPSKVMTSLCDKYHRREENGGKPVDYSGLYTLQGAVNVFETLGIDYIDIWCKTFPTVGINPWLSFRMNDDHDHYPTKETSWLLSDFYYDHPEDRRVTYRKEHFDYGDYTLDYSKEIVREYYKAFIDEALDRYDPYGIEIDWQRDYHIFAIGKEYEGAEILNGFMRDIDKIVAKYEKKYGHEIKIAARVCSTPDLSYDWGFDVMTWVREGIVDMVIPSANWSTTDYDIPVHFWKSLLKGYNVELCPAVECNIKCWYGGDRPAGKHTIETHAGLAASFYSQGADKVYFFNHFQWLWFEFEKEPKIDLNPENDIRGAVGYYTEMHTLGDDEFVLNNMTRRNIITYRDTPFIGKLYDQQFPKTFKTHGMFKLHVGKIPEGARVTLKVSTYEDKANENPTVVYVNGVECKYIGREEPNEYTLEPMACYEIPAEAHHEYMRPDICSLGVEMTVTYMEVKIEPKK